MNNPLLQSLFLSKDTIKSMNYDQVRDNKHTIHSNYNMTKKICDIVTVIAGVVILLTISPYTENVFKEVHQVITPSLSFFAFCIINTAFLVKWRLTITYKRLSHSLQLLQSNSQQIRQVQTKQMYKQAA